MKRYLLLVLIIILVLTPGLVGCAQETTTYYNSEFGYSVEMPKNWVVIEEPRNIVGHRLEDTIGFQSELSLDADWVHVGVKSVDVWWDIGDVRFSDGNEYKIHKYGENGYIVERRSLSTLSDRKWKVTYYIKHDRKLYTITFNDKGTPKKVYVAIDGYGKVNY